MQKLILVLCLLIPTAAWADGDDARKACVAAMNADPSFATDIVRTVNAQTAQQHLDAADAIAKNERHVILAYAAMWVVAAGFVLFLWNRQRTLKQEIVQLRGDLAAAIKDSK
jgi:hypothetical protein